MPRVRQARQSANEATPRRAAQTRQAPNARQQLREQAAQVGYQQGRQMLAPPGPTQAQPAVRRGTVDHAVSDAPYGWTTKYDVAVTDAECRVTIKVKLEAQEGVTADDVRKVAADSTASFARIWDNRFRLTDRATNRTVPLRAGVEFVESGEHLAVKLRKGAGRDNMSNWFVQSDALTRAHELGHAIGIKDEYIDASAESRKDASAPGVHTDNSVMGNYYAEGTDKAEAKLRHGEVLAGDIGGAVGASYTASLATPEPTR
jgi:hypothetical protein